MSWALTALQLVLASLLILAAAAKFLQADDFIAALRLSHVPEVAVSPLAFVVPTVELGLGLWLLVAGPALLPGAFAAAATLFAAFTSWMVWVRARGLHVRCGCFGPNGGQVGQRTIARNLGLLLASVVGVAAARAAVPALYEQSLWWFLTVIAFALVLAMAAAVRFAVPHLTLSASALRGGAARE